MLVANSGISLLSWFGLVAVALMLICYAIEHLSHWFIIAFAASCVLGSLYGFLVGAWPLGILMAAWALVAYWRWHRRRKALPPPVT